jgi:hypothetical protein
MRNVTRKVLCAVSVLFVFSTLEIINGSFYSKEVCSNDSVSINLSSWNIVQGIIGLCTIFVVGFCVTCNKCCIDIDYGRRHQVCRMFTLICVYILMTTIQLFWNVIGISSVINSQCQNSDSLLWYFSLIFVIFGSLWSMFCLYCGTFYDRLMVEDSSEI